MISSLTPYIQQPLGQHEDEGKMFMQVHALVVFGPASNTLARLQWFASIRYVIGGQEYSSNDIEHGVLRNNKPSPANLLSLVGLSSIAPKTFKPGDARLSQVAAHSPCCSPVE